MPWADAFNMSLLSKIFAVYFYTYPLLYLRSLLLVLRFFSPFCLKIFKHQKGCKNNTVNIHISFILNTLKYLFYILCLISGFDVCKLSGDISTWSSPCMYSSLWPQLYLWLSVLQSTHLPWAYSGLCIWLILFGEGKKSKVQGVWVSKYL